MADIGLNQNITLKNRTFHIQTATSVDDGLIRTEVFERGRLLYTEYYKYERRDYSQDGGADLRLRRLLDQFHHNVISGIETLFELSRKLEDKDHSISHHRLGAIFLSLHLYEEAEKHLLRSIDLDPESFSSYIVLARCYFLQKRFQQAAQTLEPLLKRQLAYPDLYNLMGMLSLEQKNYVDALNHFRHSIKLNPNYTEAYFNLGMAILYRVNFLRMQGKKEEVQKNLKFFALVLQKISKIGDSEDKTVVSQILQALTKKNYGKVSSTLYDYRNKRFYQRVPPETAGYEFYLWLRYLPEQLDYEILCHFEEKISRTLDQHPDYPDMWNNLALIHLMLCREYFLKGLDNFKEATKINPGFTRAQKNLRLVENDGREFLSLIKAIFK